MCAKGNPFGILLAADDGIRQSPSTQKLRSQYFRQASAFLYSAWGAEVGRLGFKGGNGS
jgi:hypothetical protein